VLVPPRVPLSHMALTGSSGSGRHREVRILPAPRV